MILGRGQQFFWVGSRPVLWYVMYSLYGAVCSEHWLLTYLLLHCGCQELQLKLCF